MRTPFLVGALAAVAFASAGLAQDRPSCGLARSSPGDGGVPGYLLFSDSQLKRVTGSVTASRKLAIAVVGTGSSALAGPEGPSSAYPARLEAALAQRLPGLSINVVTLLRTRQTAEDLARGMSKLVVDEKPNLVIWQTGTIDAIRRIDPDNFKSALLEGVSRLHRGGADVILMNPQYSPRTESMISVGPYADIMRVVAEERDVPLFDRLGMMRHWSEVGAFDLYAAGKDNMLAQRVHDCIGRAMTLLIINSGHLETFERKAGQ
jgi:hypothetical protein